MSYNDQNEQGLPAGSSQKRRTASLLPQVYRTDSNRKFLQSTLDQLTQPGTVKKINGYIGRQYSKSTTSSDIFLTTTDAERSSYQLEPAAVIKDELGNVKFYKDYIDHINHIELFNGNTKNHARINDEQVYSWNPHIDFDKFTNYQNYYWMPYGPKPINVYGALGDIETTMPVSIVDDGDNFSYVFDKEIQTRNPELVLYRGQTYIFDIISKNNPFYIKTSRLTGIDDIYAGNILNNGIESGKLTITIDRNTPNILYYVSKNDENLSGVIRILDLDENSSLNVETDILYKSSYKMQNGYYLSNGMKLKFHGNITPTKYSTGYWYVEGVGSNIQLISENDIALPSTIRNSKFDYDPFDSTAFDMQKSFPHGKDYIVINRASMDRNAWSRSNRWFHQDVIIQSAELNNVSPDLDQSFRAIRPIIEFEPNIKLVNFGHKCKSDIDLIDFETKDVFSTIEGSLTHYVDGVKLANGMRVIFAADTDSMVNGKIYKVEYVTINVPGRTVGFSIAGVNIGDNTISFTESHGFQDGIQITYVNNGFPDLGGLINRNIYFVKVISEKVIKLFKDVGLQIPVYISSLGTNSSLVQQSFEIYLGRRRQIMLIEEEDTNPLTNEIVLVKNGKSNIGKIFWYNGTNWTQGQEKNSTNQSPLFDVFDSNKQSYMDATVYPSSTFIGTKLFSYKSGTGLIDTELGFPLTYRSINNIGDISFDFNLLSDSFNYTTGSKLISHNISDGYLQRIKTLEDVDYINGWDLCSVSDIQGIIRIYKNTTITSDFLIDVFDTIPADNDLRVKVYKNGVKLSNSEYSVESKNYKKYVVLSTPALASDIITLKLYSTRYKNENGFYEIPISLQNNPLNNDITQFTLGQVVDHVNGITENIPGFDGIFPGSSNLRDLAAVHQYGTRFVQHLCPMNFSLYHLGSKSANLVEAIVAAGDDYGKFKRAFLTVANQLGIHTEPKEHVDAILAEITKNKATSSSYYLSDMIAYTGTVKNEYIVLDARTTAYPLSRTFSMNVLSNNAVLVYLNGVQLLHGTDYVFYDDFVDISTQLAEDDVITVFEYDSTDGSCCPPTPTKLGLYPKFEPKIYIDNTYLEPTKVIQGHDGSITVAFNDYRDDLILELEKRIYNNIKISYNASMFDINDYIPGYNRTTDYTREEVNEIISQSFYQWTGLVIVDFTKNQAFDRENPFTYNYFENYAPNGTNIPSYWRGIFNWMYDTDRPHLCPWEMLGFSEIPVWWESTYGPAPYTSNNEILWDDIKQGIIREPGRPVVVNEKYIRSVLEFGLPVDENGSLVDPIQSGIALGVVNMSGNSHFIIGDGSPVETTWKKSSYFPFALLRAILVMKPNDVIGKCFDRSRIHKNIVGQYVYTTGKRIILQDLVIPSTYTSDNRVQTSGLVNYLVEFINSEVQVRLTDYISDLQLLTNNISSKMGGFSSKEKYRLLMDSKSPTTPSGNFVPEENYQIFLNTSSVVRKAVYSGVVITKTSEGFEVKGYSIDTPYFNVNPFLDSGRTIRIGGISESFVEWTPSTYYVAGKVIDNNGRYYRVNTTHRSGDAFEPSYFNVMAELPVYGGAEVTLRKSWDTRISTVVNYGTLLDTVQDVADFLQGYGSYLENQGFIFDSYSSDIQNVYNWQMMVKEFLFWTTQNWPENSVISLSPSAEKLKLKIPYTVVNDINDPFFKYEVMDVSGKPIDYTKLSTYRDGSEFTLTSTDANIGVYGATLYAVQKEHVLILDNKTIFNDVIYDLEPGYRQERIKVLGYISRNWDGGFDIPGFIFDQANVYDWEPWTDYHFGDTVKHKEFYYSAKYFIPGTVEFNVYDWVKQSDKPVSRMLPNWDYKAEQFTDFYDLDTDNFDSQQQKMAQHLIGYQKRQYLENIIKDDVSQYKFYQGMIIEKGTANVFSKLFDVLSATDKNSVDFDEEWAIRVGEYGAVDVFDTVEIQLDETKFVMNPQGIEFVPAIIPDIQDHIYRFTKDSIYINPKDVDDNTVVKWKEKIQSGTLRTPGYVRYDDVDYSIDKLEDLLDTDVNLYSEHQIFWCAFNDKLHDSNFRYWDVYSFEKYIGTWTSICEESQVMKISLDPLSLINISAGDVIGIKSGNFTKFVIADINTTSDTLTIVDNNFSINDTLSNIEIYVFNSLRYGNQLSQSDFVSQMSQWNPSVKYIWGDWVQNGVTQGWEVYKNNGSLFDNTILYSVDDIVVYNNSYYIVIAESIGHLPTDTSYFELYVGDKWSIHHSSEWTIDSSIIKKAYLYNKDTSELVRYIDLVDVVNGKIPGIADQEIKYKMYNDPAVYSVGTANVKVLPEANWGATQVGQLWWDLTRAKFIVSNDNEIEYRTNTWNQLYKSASIDIFEWVESSILPADWDDLDGTEEGLALGISGRSKYGNSSYSVVTKFDNVTGIYYNTYYFWVKGKQITPNVGFRNIDAYNVAAIIGSPENTGYPCISVTSTSSFILTNIEQYLDQTNIILVIEYWNVDKVDANYHTEWKLVSENINTELPTHIEQKWIDSLIGYDYNENRIPDYSLKPKQRYGIENKPRQSMFINRLEALKQVIERTNNVLKTNLIADDFDLSPLMKYDLPPSSVSGKWDVTVDYDTELQYIGTALLKQAEISLYIVDGRIEAVNITDPGYGYVNPPEVVIAGNNGCNNQAKIILTLDNNGSVSTAEIIDHGENYTDETVATIRRFAVLVLSDSQNEDRWVIRHWYENYKSWLVRQVRKYDVRKCWYYIDWYATGYNQFTSINHVVDNTSQLYTSSHNIGDIVKVKNIGTGGWLLLQKYNELVTTDYTKIYNVIGRENGTIQFSDILYDYDTNIFPGTIQNPDPYAFNLRNELRVILSAIKDNLLVDNLRIEYLKLFFASVRYILSEQIYTDWIFKSSFIKVTHNVGELKQKVTYNSDNLESFEDYINEIKPYRTKIREYVSVYDGYDNSNSNITDFDFPSVVTSDNIYATINNYVSEDGTLVVDDNYYTNISPWKSWYDNIGFKVSSINIIDGGSGYTKAPIVRFIGGYGKNAEATAFISRGKVNRIVLDNPGTGYLSAPIIVLDGGVSSAGVTARASVTIESEAARSTKITMKYDRVAKGYSITDLLYNETFTGTGTRQQFKLIFAPDLRVNTASVYVDGVEQLHNSYYVAVKTDTSMGYTRYYGTLTLVTAPRKNSVIEITYLKNIEYLNANDRIQFNYNPSYGNPGKDLSLLMKGIDYGGVIVTGGGFQFANGWDSIPWDSDEWDAFDPGYDNWSISVPRDTGIIQLPYTPDVGEKVNVYVNNIRVDEPTFVAPHENIIMGTIVGDGLKNSFTIPGDIPSTIYDIGQQYNNNLVVSDYTDRNIIIIGGGSVQIPAGQTVMVDTFSKYSTTSIRYDIAYSNAGVYGYIELILINNPYTASSVNGNTIVYGGGGATPEIDLGFMRLTVEQDPLSSSDILLNVHATNTVIVTYTKWDFSKGGIYNEVTSRINDPLFEISSDSLTIYEMEETVIDEFDKNEFYSGCYYIQLVSDSFVQLLEVELVHNGVDINIDIISTDGDIILDTMQNGDSWISSYIENDNILLSLKTIYDKVTVVYSRVMLPSLTIREVDITDVRRLSSDGEYAIIPFQYQSTSTTRVLVDSFDFGHYAYCDFQIQLIGSVATQVYDIDVFIDPNIIGTFEFVVKNNTYVGRECGYFTGSLNGDSFELYFTPYEANVQITGVKRLLGRPGVPNINQQDELGLDNLFNIMFIKQTSDGGVSTNPYIDEYELGLYDYDVRLIGGIFEDSTVIGYKPDDVITDGDGFITPSTSYAPEELLPGHMADSVAIKVYQLPTSGSPKVINNRYIPDGTTTVYSYGQDVPTGNHVIVTQRRSVSGKIKNVTIPSSDYVLDTSNHTVVFNVAPTGDAITVSSFGFNSYMLLDTDIITINKATDVIVTNAPWMLGNVKATVLVNGNTYQYELFRTTEKEQKIEVTGIRFGAKLPKNTIVQYMIEQSDTGNINTSTTSVMDIDTTQSYTGPADYVMSVSAISPNVLVLIDDVLLSPGKVVTKEVTQNDMSVRIPEYMVSAYELNYSNVEVYSHTKQLRYITDYNIESASGVIILTETVSPGLITVLVKDATCEYTISDMTLTITKNLPAGNMKIISFYDYGLLELDRRVDSISSATNIITNPVDQAIFTGMQHGIFVLKKPVLSLDYIWVSKNGNILTRNIDYTINVDLIKITLTDALLPTDVVQIITFSNNIIKASLGFMQFKDILNRDHYKRLDGTMVTSLAMDLAQFDTTIYVEDGSKLDDPTPAVTENQVTIINGQPFTHAVSTSPIPGIIEINGERIEYFTKNGNELSDLRRGTLGTSSPTIHKIQTNVLNMGRSETIPYNDLNNIESFVTKRKTRIVPVSFIPRRRCDNPRNVVNVSHLSEILEPSAYTYYFVDGGTELWFYHNGQWDVVNQYSVTDDVEVFVGGVRLKKDWYTTYGNTNYPYSPEGDIEHTPEFMVNGTGYYIKLTKSVPKGVGITVVRKTGKEWYDMNNEDLSTANNNIARFIRSVESSWPQYLVDKYQYIVAMDSNISLESDGTTSDIIELD